LRRCDESAVTHKSTGPEELLKLIEQVSRSNLEEDAKAEVLAILEAARNVKRQATQKDS